MAPGLPLLPDSAGYRLYIESLFDELSTEVKVLFDRRDPSSVLWPKRATFEQLLDILNATELAPVWGEDETIGWVYQYFNGGDERRAMRDASQSPRNSRELAVRNQFFTPRYVVRFLTENTLARIWIEMMGGPLNRRSVRFLVRDAERRSPRAKEATRPGAPAVQGFFYSFDLLLVIYEGWPTPRPGRVGRTLSRTIRRLSDRPVLVPSSTSTESTSIPAPRSRLALCAPRAWKRWPTVSGRR
jgi:hypothetical protein